MKLPVALTAALIATSLTAATAAANAENRYDLVHGCYTVATEAGQPIGAAAGPFRMQATRLGQYLLYGKDKDFLADPGTGVPTPTATPSPSAEWIVRGSADTGFSLTNKATGLLQRVSFSEADGCAVYPEITPGATGTPRGNAQDAPAFGYVDGHMHWMGFELFGGDWHCGRPWHPYGAPYALPDCASLDVGANEAVRAAEDGRTPGEPYDTVGWPTFGFWPGANRLADEATYYTSVQRAWMAGLRILVVLYVDNEAMCDLMTVKHLPCNDMDAVRKQNQDLEELQDYIDAQAGGPGKGFLRLVTSPEEARKVVADGKLAVVKGIELSRVLNCGESNGVPEPVCDQQHVDAGLRELWDMGVRDFFPVHKFDNGFGGTKGDGGQTGYIVNLGNFSKTHHWWDFRHCDTPTHDQTQIEAPDQGTLDLLYNSLGTMMQPAARVPIYGAGPHCNTRGLTDIGTYLINRMVDEHFIVETDHMDELTADATMTILEKRHYSGVINSHGGWSSDKTIKRIAALGGMSTLGSDINGLATQPGRPSTDRRISYPFTSVDGKVTFDRQQWGQRTFDFNNEGIAQYGEYADWLASRTPAERDRLFGERGAEAYIEMWERAFAHKG